MALLTVQIRRVLDQKMKSLESYHLKRGQVAPVVSKRVEAALPEFKSWGNLVRLVQESFMMVQVTSEFITIPF